MANYMKPANYDKDSVECDLIHRAITCTVNRKDNKHSKAWLTTRLFIHGIDTGEATRLV